MTELTQIKPITANEAELKQLAEDYGNLVVTTQNLDAADKARLRLKNERITIQRQEKANNDVLKQIKKDNEGRAEMLIGIIKPVEDKLDTAITAIKEAEAKKKEQEKLKEQNVGPLVVIPDNTTPEDIIKIYRQTGQLMTDSSQLRVPINYSTMGYDFHIPVTIPQQYQDKIKSAIESVLGEMPLV